MKRKNLIAAIAAAMCLCVSCNKLEMPEITHLATEQEAPERFVPMQTEFVEVPQGCKTLIIRNGEILATAYASGHVILPKVPATRAIENYQIISMPNETASNVASKYELEMVVAFEDTKEGDHDYNDLVFQAHMNIVNAVSGENTVDVEITPVAMGASRKLGLGVVLTNAEGTVLEDKLITGDCREFFFEGDTSFINTMDNRKKFEAVPVTITTEGGAAVAGISWYLVSGNEKLYASNYFQPCLDNSNMPQGLVIMKVRGDVYYKAEGTDTTYCGNSFWQYPRESFSIETVYPGFTKAFLEGGDFSVFANPEGRYYDAIAAEQDGGLTEDCLYTVYVPEEEEDGEVVETYYDNAGQECKVPQSFDAIYNIFNHSQDNFINEFSTAKGNPIDFAAGEMIEAKITYAKQQYYFNIGNLTVDAPGKAIEGYSDDMREWFRVQDAYTHVNSSKMDKGGAFKDPLIVRISLAKGVEYFYNGKFEQRVTPTDSTLASILELGTDTPLYFGLFGNVYEEASYEYFKVIREGKPNNIDTVIHVRSISVDDMIIMAGEKDTLTAVVLPQNATNKAVTWSSSNENVAKVNAVTGEVEGIGKGHCTITATSVDNPNITGTCLVTVTVETQEVMIWQNYEVNTTEVETKQFEIIESGTPNDNQICFNNGDYIEVKLQRLEVAAGDRDLIYVGSKASGVTPNMIVQGNSSKYAIIYMIPAGWWKVANFNKADVGDDIYVRFGCKADMTPGAGSWSHDGVAWESFSSTNDFESKWTILTDPSNSPLIIQTARNAGFLQQTNYEYVKIVREGATVE